MAVLNPIAFSIRTRSGIWTIQPDGSNALDVAPSTPPNAWKNPACSPARIAASFNDGSRHLYLMGRDGIAPTAITARPSDADADLDCPFAWSPDGTQLAMAYQESAGGSPQEGIATVNADNSGFSKIPLGASDGTHIYMASNGAVRWSPDGTKFAYLAAPVVGGLAAQYCSNSGTGATLVKGDVSALIDWYLYDWFPDSAHLLLAKFDATGAGPSGPWVITLCKVALDGTIVTTIYSDSDGTTLYWDGSFGFHRDGAVSPDGLQVLLATVSGLATVSALGGTPTPIYAGESALQVSWDPPPAAPPSTIAAGPPTTGIIRLS